MLRILFVALGLSIAFPALGDDSEDGPMMTITAEQSDVYLEAPQFLIAKATFHRQRIHKDRGLRDLAIYRALGEISTIMYDTLDPDIVGSMMKGESTEDTLRVLNWFLPKDYRFALGATGEHRNQITTLPYQHVRLTWPGGGGNCIVYFRAFDPQPGRSTSTKRLGGIYCRTIDQMNEQLTAAFFDGIRIKQRQP